MRGLFFELVARVEAIEGSCHKSEQVGRNLLRSLKLVHLYLLVSKGADDARISRYAKPIERTLVLLVIRVDSDSGSGIDILAVRDHFPVFRGNNATFVGCFEVRLIEAREDNMAVVGLKLGVDVL